MTTSAITSSITTPVERRVQAVNNLLMSVTPTIDTAKGPVTIWAKHRQHQHEIAADIRRLHTLGRTQRWLDAIENWAEVVESAPDDTKFEWAVLQYAIFASYAA